MKSFRNNENYHLGGFVFKLLAVAHKGINWIFQRGKKAKD